MKAKQHKVQAAGAKSNATNSSSPSENVAGFSDNRPEAIAQRRLRDEIDNAPSDAIPIARRKNKTGLPDNLKTGIETLSGHSMDDVKVHYNSARPAQLNAHAYAQGTNIHVATGQEKHLPHEAWHVVQQKQGRVKPTVQLMGQSINDDAGLENEADVMGAKALQAKQEKPAINHSPGKEPIRNFGIINNDLAQLRVDQASTVSQTWNLATKRANRDETSGFTPPVVNATEYAPGMGSGWVNANLVMPGINTVQEDDGVHRTTVTGVPNNTLGYNMYLPAPPGPWNDVADKNYILGYYGIHPLEGAGNVNLRVVGHPDNATFLQKVRAHEDVHAADIDRAINEILMPWDEALQECQRNGTEFTGDSQVEAEGALWEAVGGSPQQIAANLDAQWTADNDAYHQSHEGGSDVESATYDPETNTVTLSVNINQPLPEGSNWLMLTTIVVLGLALLGGLYLSGGDTSGKSSS